MKFIKRIPVLPFSPRTGRADARGPGESARALPDPLPPLGSGRGERSCLKLLIKLAGTENVLNLIVDVSVVRLRLLMSNFVPVVSLMVF